jgi:hypothetical protein
LQNEAKIMKLIKDRLWVLSGKQGVSRRTAPVTGPTALREEVPEAVAVLAGLFCAEEARLTWCVVAFDQSTEGRARKRIDELRWKSFWAGYEKGEVSDRLRTLYPDQPPDPDSLLMRNLK